MLRGRLELPLPYLVEGDGNFELGRDETASIPILFTPAKPGSYPFSISPVPGEPATLVLKGEALQPFAVEAAEFEFQEQPDQSRIASAAVKNQSQSPQQISVVLPPDVPVEPVPALDLSPGASTNVTLYIPAATKTRVAPFDVRFETADHAMVLEFQAPPIPPNVIVVTSPDFGPVKPGTATRAALVLSNAGGAVADCRLQTAKNLTAEDGAPAFAVAPGTARNVTLKLVPKKDQDLPTNVVVTFRDQKLSIPIKATWVDEPEPPIVCDLTRDPEPPPKVAELELNKDIKLERKNGATFISCREQQGWTNFILQHRMGGTGEWQDYQLPNPHEGLLGWITSLARRIQDRLDTPIERTKIEGVDLEDSYAKLEIAPDKIDGSDVWLVLATPSGESDPRPVSDEFRITSESLVAAKPEAPVAQAVPPPAPTPESTTRPRIAGPVTEMASAGIRSERNSAIVQVAFAQDLGVSGFRLERGAMVARIDPKTQIPQAPEFEKMDPPEAEVELLGLADGEAEGKKFTICAARISKLEAGSRTYWRIVPEVAKGALPPTTVILVDTLPRPPFPWNTLLLGTLVLLLAGVLYLRWRMNQPPA